MQNELRVVGIQANLAWEDAEENRNRFYEKIDRIDEDVDLIVLPEMFTTGFTMNPSLVAESMHGETVHWMQKIAAKKNCAVTGSVVISEGDHFYNRLFFVHSSGNIEAYDKKHTFTLAGEDKVYRSGNEKVLIDYKGWKIYPLICYDLRFPVWSRNTEGYDLLLYVANWPVQRIDAWDTLLKARAIENMSFVIGVNRVGEDANGHQYSGNSLIIDSLGNEMDALEANEEGIVRSTLHKDQQDKTRDKLGFLHDKDAFTLS